MSTTTALHPAWCSPDECDHKDFNDRSFTHWKTVGTEQRRTVPGQDFKALVYQCVADGVPGEPGVYLDGIGEELTLWELDDLIDMLTAARKRAAEIVPAK